MQLEAAAGGVPAASPSSSSFAAAAAAVPHRMVDDEVEGEGHNCNSVVLVLVAQDC